MEPLKPFDALTKSDGRWEMFRVDLPLLYKITKDMTLSDEVPEYVLVQFQQAQHLIIYSHLQFSLLSVALTQALIAVESALKGRWMGESEQHAGGRKPGMKRLLEIAFNKGWMDGFDMKLISLIPALRNASAHGEYNLNPVGTVELVQLCCRLIQQLYPESITQKVDHVQ